jgi:hypothetical protein
MSVNGNMLSSFKGITSLPVCTGGGYPVPAGSLVFLDLIVSGIYGAKLGDRVVSVNTAARK